MQGLDDTICPGSEYQLVGSVGDTMRWEPAELLDNPDIYNPTVSIMGTTRVHLHCLPGWLYGP